MEATAPHESDSSGNLTGGYIETIKLDSQFLEIKFVAPSSIRVYSEYVFEVIEPENRVLVGYLPDLRFPFEEKKQPEYYFTVSVDGKELEEAEITADPGRRSFLFPIDFEEKRKYLLEIKYGYELVKGFSVMKKKHRIQGYLYYFSPAKFWAGGVDRINVNFIFDGGDVTDLTLIHPTDFRFTESGVEWEWVDLSDEWFDHDAYVDIKFGRVRPLRGVFYPVFDKYGVEVRESPSFEAPVITELSKGARVYVVEVYKSEGPQGEDDFKWFQCRMLDNTIGYIPSVSKDEFTLVPLILLDNWDYDIEFFKE